MSKGMGEYFGDEPEIEEYREKQKEMYEEEHADDWKYDEE